MVVTSVLDTSATNHFLCSVDLLTSITAIRQSLVQLPNGESAQVTHIGTIVLSSSLILKNVLCIPSFSFNLLSISSLTQSQPYCCVFLSAYYFVQDLTSWKTIGVGKTLDGLYLLQLDSLQQSSSSSLATFLAAYNINDVFDHFTAATSTPVSSQSSSIWHVRLGHPSDVKLNTLSHVIPTLKPSCNKHCQICPMAKLKRLPFPFHNKISSCAFDLIHMDVWGPYSTPNLDGFKYFLIVVDDATRATWLFLMKSKYEVR